MQTSALGDPALQNVRAEIVTQTHFSTPYQARLSSQNALETRIKPWGCWTTIEAAMA
jgi:hypothetical protein